MEITLQTIAGDSFQLRLSPYDTIEYLKLRIEMERGIASNCVRLVYGEKELNQDELTLRECKIEDGSSIRLLVSVRGGPINVRRVVLPSLSQYRLLLQQQQLQDDLSALLRSDRDLEEQMESEEIGGKKRVAVVVNRSGSRTCFLTLSSERSEDNGTSEHEVTENKGNTQETLSSSTSLGGTRGMEAVGSGTNIKSRAKEYTSGLRRLYAWSPPTAAERAVEEEHAVLIDDNTVATAVPIEEERDDELDELTLKALTRLGKNQDLRSRMAEVKKKLHEKQQSRMAPGEAAVPVTIERLQDAGEQHVHGSRSPQCLKSRPSSYHRHYGVYVRDTLTPAVRKYSLDEAIECDTNMNSGPLYPGDGSDGLSQYGLAEMRRQRRERQQRSLSASLGEGLNSEGNIGSQSGQQMRPDRTAKARPVSSTEYQAMRRSIMSSLDRIRDLSQTYTRALHTLQSAREFLSQCENGLTSEEITQSATSFLDLATRTNSLMDTYSQFLEQDLEDQMAEYSFPQEFGAGVAHHDDHHRCDHASTLHYSEQEEFLDAEDVAGATNAGTQLVATPKLTTTVSDVGASATDPLPLRRLLRSGQAGAVSPEPLSSRTAVIEANEDTACTPIQDSGNEWNRPCSPFPTSEMNLDMLTGSSGSIVNLSESNEKVDPDDKDSPFPRLPVDHRCSTLSDRAAEVHPTFGTGAFRAPLRSSFVSMSLPPISSAADVLKYSEPLKALPAPEVPEPIAEAPAVASSPAPVGSCKTTKNPNRCQCCNKKVSLATRFSCRCGGNFCGRHRYAEQHSCTYDYKTNGRMQLRETNPQVVPEKLPQI
eukprot:Clim_evm2s181 gene=Clim_evmTU2s181